jgi:SSS family solute:Na+ symporter
LIQFSVKIGGALIAACCIVAWSPQGWAGIATEAEAAGKLDWLRVTLDPTVAYPLWAGLLGGAFFTMASHGADQMMVQRYLCGRSLGEARLALVLSGVVVLLQTALFLLIGIGLWALNRFDVVHFAADIRSDAVFGQFIVTHLPAGLRGLVIAAVLAAAMSTLSASLNSSATAFVVDYYRPLRPSQSEGHYLTVSRGMTLFWGLVQVGVALTTLWLAPKEAIITNVLTVAGMTTGIVLGLFTLGSLQPSVSSTAAMAGVLLGAAVVGLVFVFTPTTWRTAWLWYALIGTLTTVLSALLADRLVPKAASEG